MEKEIDFLNSFSYENLASGEDLNFKKLENLPEDVNELSNTQNLLSKTTKNKFLKRNHFVAMGCKKILNETLWISNHRNLIKNKF